MRITFTFLSKSYTKVLQTFQTTAEKLSLLIYVCGSYYCRKCLRVSNEARLTLNQLFLKKQQSYYSRMKDIPKLEILLNLIPIYESTKTSDFHPAVSQLVGTHFLESLLRHSPFRSCAEREWEVIRLAGSSFVCRMFLFKYSFKKVGWISLVPRHGMRARKQLSWATYAIFDERYLYLQLCMSCGFTSTRMRSTPQQRWTWIWI